MASPAASPSRGVAARRSIPSLAGVALRRLGDQRLAFGLLLLAAIWNAVAAAAPGGQALLDAWPYAVLLGAVLLTGMAAVAVRLPATWAEWRNPAAVVGGPGSLESRIVAADGGAMPPSEHVASVLHAAGYRVTAREGRSRWAVSGVRRGWTRFAGLATHIALVLMVLGAALGAAFATETTLSLLPGDQALLDAARPGFTDSVRLDRLDAAFGADDRPERLDTTVTFLRDGAPVEQQLVQVNQPGSFGGYLVHAQTYGPAARLRVTTLDGRPLLDGPVALDGRIGGAQGQLVDLPPVRLTMGVALAGGGQNQLQITLADASGVLDAAALDAGDEARIGGLRIAHRGLDAYVTFLSRQDPGMGVLFAGAALLCLGLAVALWLPRRRVLVTPVGGDLLLRLRGERFDDASGELERLRRRLADATIAP